MLHSFGPYHFLHLLIQHSSYVTLVYPYTSCEITLHPYSPIIPWNQLEEEKEKVQLSELRHQDMTSNWLAERDVLKGQLSDLQTRNDNLQMSLVNRDMIIEKLVRVLTCIKKIYQYLLFVCSICVSVCVKWCVKRTICVYRYLTVHKYCIVTPSKYMWKCILNVVYHTYF
jgi:hypothetical protein